MSEQFKLTSGEWGLAAMSVLVTGATDLRMLPFAALGLVVVAKARRSKGFGEGIAHRLDAMEYDPESGNPLAGRLLAGLPVGQGTALAVLPKAKSGQTVVKPAVKGKGRLGGMFSDFATSVSSTPRAEETAAETEVAVAVEEEAPEKAPAVVVDPDAAWLAKATGDAQVAVQAGLKALRVSEVCERLNTNIDDSPHVFVVGNSGAGKTIFTQLLVASRPGKVVILDQKRPKGWEGPKWGGLPYVARDRDTASYGPMVAALKQVVAEMDRRYRHQDEATEPYEQLTVVLDEAKNTVDECEELATYYKKIVSIGREVGVRLILISTSDRARKLGFDGEADSMDSFTWVVFGEKACVIQPSVKARGTERYFWAAVDFFGQWVPFENEKAFGLVKTIVTRPDKAWRAVTYNCQVAARQIESKVTRPMAALANGKEPSGYQTTPAEEAMLAAMLQKYDRSVKNKSPESDREVQSSALLTSQRTSPQQNATSVTSPEKFRRAETLKKALLTVPEDDKKKLGKALQCYATNGQKITAAIVAGWDNSGGPLFSQRGDWVRAAYEIAMMVRQ